MGIFIYAFTATGKSTVTKKYSNVIDMESTLYKYICNTPISVNELARKTKFSVNEILSALFILEMDGFVKKVEGGFVCTKT